MPSFDIILPAKDGGALSGASTPGARPAPARSSEPFDALMNRAIAGSRGEKDDFTRASNSARRTSKNPGSNRTGEGNASSAQKPGTRSHTEQPSFERAVSPAGSELDGPSAAGETGQGTSSDEEAASPAAGAGTQEQPAGFEEGNATGTAVLQTLDSCPPTVVPVPAVSAGGILQISAQVPVPGTATSLTPNNSGDGAPNTSGAAIANQQGNGTKGLPATGNSASALTAAKGSESAAAGQQLSQALAAEGAGNKGPASSLAATVAAMPPGLDGQAEPGRNSIAGQGPPLEAGSGGISAAQQSPMMKKTEEMPKIAGAAEKDLPGAIASVAGEGLPVREELAGNLASRIEAPAATVTASSAAADRISTPTEASSTASISPSANTELHVRVLERTHDIVALHAMRLRDSSAESLHVVIKPGGDLQLSLELRQRDGGIEAQAVLNRGDFEQLNQHWAELQQRLQQRGVRLSPLAYHESPAGSGSEGSQQQQRQPARQDSLAAGAFAEFALAGSLTETPARRAERAAAYRGWETWA